MALIIQKYFTRNSLVTARTTARPRTQAEIAASRSPDAPARTHTHAHNRMLPSPASRCHCVEVDRPSTRSRRHDPLETYALQLLQLLHSRRAAALVETGVLPGLALRLRRVRPPLGGDPLAQGWVVSDLVSHPGVAVLLDEAPQRREALSTRRT